MHKLKGFLVAAAGAAALAAIVPAVGVAAQPVVSGHFNFTSDPYLDNVCGVDVTAVDRVVETFKQDASGASIDTASVTTTFTAASGRSVEFHRSGLIKQTAATDNGDGTISFVFVITGNAPQIKIPNGPVIGHSTGTATLLVTADASHPDHFISFEFVRDTGLPKDGGGDTCLAIASYLTGP
jgi:hypothetical protein